MTKENSMSGSWESRHDNLCKHPELIKPDPPEPIWFDKKPYKCVECGEQIHATQVEEVDGKLQIVDYSKFANRNKRRR